MKKLFLLFAVAGMIASCTGNGTTSGSASASGEAKDGENVEQTTDEGQEVAIEDQKELDAKAFNLKVPENWKATSRVVGGNSCNITLKENPYTTAALNYNSLPIEKITENMGNNDFTPVDDLTVGDKTCKLFFREKDSEYQAFIPQGDGFVNVSVSAGGTNMDNAQLKDVLLKNLEEVIGAITIK